MKGQLAEAELSREKHGGSWSEYVEVAVFLICRWQKKREIGRCYKNRENDFWLKI